MPEVFVYLIKVNLALLLFYLVYHLLMRRLTFYTMNRFYLLFGIGFSAIYPLVDISNWFKKDQEMPIAVQGIIPDWQSVSAGPSHVWPYMQVLFWAIVCFFLIRFVLRLFSLWQIHRESVPAKWQFFHYRHVMRKIDPFSFWKNIYIHSESYRDRELNEIFSHERIHVEQLHTLDTLIAELLSIVCWFNPISWLMRHAIHENLEFITDRKVLKSGINKQSYQYSLLNLATHQHQEGLATHFNLNHLKNRIRMMNKKRSSYAHLGKYVLAMPLIVVLALLFSFSKAYRTVDGQAVQLVLGEEISDSLPQETPKSLKPADRQIRIVRVREQIKHGDTASVGRLEWSPALLDEIRARGIDAASSDKRLSLQVRKDTIFVNGELYANEREDPADREEKVVTKGRITGFKITASDKAPLVLIDGVEGDLSALNPDQIKSINVLKGKSSADLAERFGQKASEGVILIETKP